MVDSSDEFFYNNVFDTSSDESDDDTEILVSLALLVHQQEQRRPQYRGSVMGHDVATERVRVAGMQQLWRDYFHRTNPIYKATSFRRRFSDVEGPVSEDHARREVLRRLLQLEGGCDR